MSAAKTPQKQISVPRGGGRLRGPKQGAELGRAAHQEAAGDRRGKLPGRRSSSSRMRRGRYQGGKTDSSIGGTGGGGGWGGAGVGVGVDVVGGIGVGAGD